MKLQRKGQIFLLFYSLAVFIPLCLYLDSVFLQSYVLLEKQETLEKVERIENLFRARIRMVEKFVVDWAVWDATYDYILEPDPQYEYANLNDSTFMDSELGFIFILDRDGKKILSKAFDLGKMVQLPFDDHLLMSVSPRKIQSGIVVYDGDKSAVISFHPVLRSDRSGTPVGVFGAGFFIDRHLISRFSSIINAPVNLIVEDTDTVKQRARVAELDENNILGSVIFFDLEGRKRIVLETIFSRGIYQAGKRAVGTYLKFLIVGLVFLTLCLFLFFRFAVVRRVRKLSREVDSIREEQFLGRRVQLSGSDEFADLKNDINRMLDTIGEMHAEMTMNELQLKVILESMPVSIVALNHERQIVFWNKKSEEITGYSMAEAETLTDIFDRILPQSERPAVKALLVNESEGIEQSQMEAVIKTRSGDEKVVAMYVMSSRFPITDWETWLMTIDITKRKKYEKKLEELASFDQLTCCYNRRMGVELLRQQIKQSRRYGTPLTVAFIDLDGLKKVNDIFGHDEGDRYITDIVEAIREHIRNSDMLSRIGGDEFLLLLPRCDIEQAREILDRILEFVGKVKAEKNRPYSLSFSYGLCPDNPIEDMTPEQLMQCADQKMYEHKKSRAMERT